MEVQRTVPAFPRKEKLKMRKVVLLTGGTGFLGTLNAGHPGGMLPLTAAERDTLHHPDLPENLYVADATILPESMGNPPILTIMALAKRISKRVSGDGSF